MDMLVSLVLLLLAVSVSPVVSTPEGDRKAAQLLLSSIDQSRDPCTDFYEFTCSNWIKNYPIPAYAETTNSFLIVTRNVQQQLKELLENNAPSSSRAINDAKTLYAACMDTNRINAVGSRELLHDLELLGGWPIIHGNLWNPQRFDLTKLLIGMAQTRATQSLFVMGFSADEKNVTRNLLH
ncbi:Peptidase family M13 containing protein, partial [Aphelenchoides avenae]